MDRVDLQLRRVDSMRSSSGCSPCYAAQHLSEVEVEAVAASIPRADPAAAKSKQADGCALVRGRGERAESSSPAISAMMAVLKLFSQREDTYAQVMVAVR